MGVTVPWISHIGSPQQRLGTTFGTVPWMSALNHHQVRNQQIYEDSSLPMEQGFPYRGFS